MAFALFLGAGTLISHQRSPTVSETASTTGETAQSDFEPHDEEGWLEEDLDVNHQGQRGFTVKTLLERGADVDAHTGAILHYLLRLSMGTRTSSRRSWTMVPMSTFKRTMVIQP